MPSTDPSKTKSSIPKRKSAVLWIATGLGFGFSPFAPGTVGTLWGIPLAWAINQIPFVPAQVAIIVILILVGIPLCTRAAAELNMKDPGPVVWDEIVTVPITFFLIPIELMSNPLVLIAGFVLHRLFDISKAPPARQIERLPNGTGIMLDDVVAGIYSCLSLHLLTHFVLVG